MGFQILPYLEENALHDIVTASQMTNVVVPIYICPSRGGPRKALNNFGSPVVLMDYPSAQPCTTKVARGPEPR